MKIYSTPVQYQHNNLMTNFKEKKLPPLPSTDELMVRLATLKYQNKVQPAKDYNHLKKRIKTNYCLQKFLANFGGISYKIAYFLLTPPKIRQQHKAQLKLGIDERMKRAQRLTIENKEKLDILSYLAENSDQYELKGMLKALKKLGLIK